MIDELGEALQSHLRELSDDPAFAVCSVEAFGDGHSGFTYLVSCGPRGATRYVARLSPPGAKIAGPSDIGRQGRIMAALGAAGLPVPEVISFSSEPAICGRSFVLLQLVDGCRYTDDPAVGSDRTVAEKAIRILHRLRSLPIESTGIAADPVFTPLDELGRWSALLDRAVEPVRALGTELQGELARTAPGPGTTSLVHGDFHYGNLLFHAGEIVAVFDWEIASLGDPLVDLGCLAVASLRRRWTNEPNPTGDVDVSLEELIELYGADQERARWFVALSCFKYAAILGYNYQLHLSGKRVDPIYEDLQGTMVGLMEQGAEVLAGRKFEAV